jgi:excisionase family DNA binding protein
MIDAELAISFAIAQAKRRNLADVGLDELLLGCLQAVSQFGIAQVGDWAFDLEELGVDWIEQPDRSGVKVAYSQPAVDLFDRAARIARADGRGAMRVYHLLAAFAGETEGLMGSLKQTQGITSAGWRAAVAKLWQPPDDTNPPERESPMAGAAKDYLTPEEAAEALSIHVQTLRAYVRSGKLPALRLAGERAIRIRRTDLETVMEPLVPQA